MNEERRLSLEELDAHTRVLLCELITARSWKPLEAYDLGVLTWERGPSVRMITPAEATCLRLSGLLL